MAGLSKGEAIEFMSVLSDLQGDDRVASKLNEAKATTPEVDSGIAIDMMGDLEKRLDSGKDLGMNPTDSFRISRASQKALVKDRTPFDFIVDIVTGDRDPSINDITDSVREGDRPIPLGERLRRFSKVKRLNDLYKKTGARSFEEAVNAAKSME